MAGLTPGLGHAETSICWRKRDDLLVARKPYSEEFRQQAVDLFRSTPGATVMGIAEDLGIGREALSKWTRERPAVAGLNVQDARSGVEVRTR